MPASHPPENQEPRTEAGKALAKTVGMERTILAIEEQAAAEARRELLAKVEGLPWHDPFTNALGGEVKVSRAVVGRAAVLALLDPSR